MSKYFAIGASSISSVTSLRSGSNITYSTILYTTDRTQLCSLWSVLRRASSSTSSIIVTISIASKSVTANFTSRAIMSAFSLRRISIGRSSTSLGASLLAAAATLRDHSSLSSFINASPPDVGTSPWRSVLGVVGDGCWRWAVRLLCSASEKARQGVNEKTGLCLKSSGSIERHLMIVIMSYLAHLKVERPL